MKRRSARQQRVDPGSPRITPARMVGVLGPAPKPQVVWEQQFDYHNDKLGEMAGMDWDQIPDAYLWYYFHDLAYSELQPELFRHLFPRCLKYWYDTLMRNSSAECGDAEFHYGLVHGDVVDRMLSKPEERNLNDFFRDGFLDRIELERGFVYDTYDLRENQLISDGRSANRWIFRFNSLGMVAPVIQKIWEEWWSLDHPGKAVSATMYASGLVYWAGENPIYQVWTPERGGGGPYLAEDDCCIFDRGWRDDNRVFMASTLSVSYVLQKLDQAADVLSACPERDLSRRVADDAKNRQDIIEIRISDLLDNLAKPSGKRPIRDY